MQARVVAVNRMQQTRGQEHKTASWSDNETVKKQRVLPVTTLRKMVVTLYE